MSCLTPARRVAEEKGCSGLGIKKQADAGGLEIFIPKP